MEEYERIGRHDEELPDPMPESDHYQHIEYSWTLLWYSSQNKYNWTRAETITSFNLLKDGWEEVPATVSEKSAEIPWADTSDWDHPFPVEYDPEEDLRHSEGKALHTAPSILAYILRELGRLTRSQTELSSRPGQSSSSTDYDLNELSVRPQIEREKIFDGRKVRHLMSDEERLFEKYRLENLPVAPNKRQSLQILKELDDSATLTLYRLRNVVKQVYFRDQRLSISRRRGRELSNELQYLVNKTPLKLIASWEKLEHSSIRTLEERTFEQARLNEPNCNSEEARNDVAVLVATRLAREGRLSISLRLDTILARYPQVRDRILDLIRDAQIQRDSS